MASITLVPDTLAAKGHRFTFLGPNEGEECEGCPVRSLCFRLAPGRRYEVTGVRNVRHPCRLHEGDRVRVCEVREVPLETTVETRHLRGTAVQWTPVPCGYPECPRNPLCHPVGAPPGRYEVMAQGEDVSCPMRYEIRRVVLRPLEPSPP